MRPLAPFRPLPWTVVTTGCAVVLALAILTPFVAPPLRAALLQGFHLVCHQLSERSFAVEGAPFALCHRCFGVVAGLLGGALLVPLVGRWREALVRFERPALFAALALAAVDWLLGLGGVWANTPASRFGTGLLAGVAAGYLLARSAAAPEEPLASMPPQLTPASVR